MTEESALVMAAHKHCTDSQGVSSTAFLGVALFPSSLFYEVLDAQRMRLLLQYNMERKDQGYRHAGIPPSV